MDEFFFAIWMKVYLTDKNEGGGGEGPEETDFGQSRYAHPDLANHFWASPRLRPSTMSRTMEVEAQKKSQGELPGNKEQRKQRKQQRKTKTNRSNNKERHWGRDKQCLPCVQATFSQNHGSCQFRRSGVLGVQVFWVFRCLGLMTFWSPKMAKILGALRPKVLTAGKKGVGPKLTKLSGG